MDNYETKIPAFEGYDKTPRWEQDGLWTVGSSNTTKQGAQALCEYLDVIRLNFWKKSC